MSWYRLYPLVLGDRVQLQQVIINLVMNGIEAMRIRHGSAARTGDPIAANEKQQVLVSVRIAASDLRENADRLFNALLTTKSQGMVWDLDLPFDHRSARWPAWSTANIPHWATFQFTLPVEAETVCEIAHGKPSKDRRGAPEQRGGDMMPSTLAVFRLWPARCDKDLLDRLHRRV